MVMNNVVNFCFMPLRPTGAFLIPYVIMLFCTGVPLFFFELTLGQFTSRGPIAIWSVCPLFQGEGMVLSVVGIRNVTAII